MSDQLQTNGVLAPLHRRIAETLSGQVNTGSLKPGQKLPSERQIAKQFQASRATVRTALQNMEQAGLITRRERRSAVVSIRRNITPHLRIACSSPALMVLLRRLTEMQIVPPRCQLQLVDIGQSEQIGRMLEHPATGADVLLCDLEYLGSLASEPQRWAELPAILARDAEVSRELQELGSVGGKLFAIPVGVSPVLMYYNRAKFEQGQIPLPGGQPGWDAIVNAAQRLSEPGKFGLQIRPKFEQLAAIMASMGSSLYGPNGKARTNDAGFDGTVRFIHALLHGKRVAPLLARVEQINPFAQGRCAMALDSFAAYKLYRRKLGDQLGVTSVPTRDTSTERPSVLTGFAVLATAGAEENAQAAHDLIRRFLTASTQRALVQIGAALPVRTTLQNVSSLGELNVPGDVAGVFLQDLRRCNTMNMAGSLEEKQALEDLFVELWLGLDGIDSICNRFKRL